MKTKIIEMLSNPDPSYLYQALNLIENLYKTEPEILEVFTKTANGYTVPVFVTSDPSYLELWLTGFNIRMHLCKQDYIGCSKSITGIPEMLKYATTVQGLSLTLSCLSSLDIEILQHIRPNNLKLQFNLDSDLAISEIQPMISQLCRLSSLKKLELRFKTQQPIHLDFEALRQCTVLDIHSEGALYIANLPPKLYYCHMYSEIAVDCSQVFKVPKTLGSFAIKNPKHLDSTLFAKVHFNNFALYGKLSDDLTKNFITSIQENLVGNLLEYRVLNNMVNWSLDVNLQIESIEVGTALIEARIKQIHQDEQSNQVWEMDLSQNRSNYHFDCAILQQFPHLKVLKLRPKGMDNLKLIAEYSSLQSLHIINHPFEENTVLSLPKNLIELALPYCAISDLGILGILPSNLETLILNNNQIRDIPSTLVIPDSLCTLKVDNNPFTEDSDISALQIMMNDISLIKGKIHYGRKSITAMTPPLSKLIEHYAYAELQNQKHHIYQLNLQHSEQDALPSSWTHYPFLEILDIRNTKFTKFPKELVDLPNLVMVYTENSNLQQELKESLRLYLIQREEVHQLTNSALQNIRYISLKSCFLKQIPEYIEQSTHLEFMDLSMNLLTAEQLQNLLTFPNLWGLDISRTPIRPTSIALKSFPNLTVLYIDKQQESWCDWKNELPNITIRLKEF